MRRLATPGEFALERAKSRLGFALLMFAIAYLVIAGRVANLTLLNEAPEAQVAESSRGAQPVTSRADITDRFGTVLATSLPTMSLCADAKKIINPAEAARQLLKVLPDLDAQKLQGDLSGVNRCAMIRRHLSPRQYYDVNRLGIAGLEFLPDERRVYPAGHLTAHVLGYTDIDGNGLAGVEKNQNDQLQERSEPLALALDLRLQMILHRELSNSLSDFKAEGAAGLIMDVRSGEVLALVSLPDFDPHQPGTADDDAKFNRDTLGVYEMGSTFKIFNTALALESGTSSLTDMFDVTKPLPIGRKFIRDFHASRRPLNLAEVFIESSNIGSAKIAERFGGIRQRAFLAQLGLTTKVPFELPEIGAPLVPSASNWREPTTMTVSFGHGIAVNAVQLAGAVGSIVNDGLQVTPTLLKQQASGSPKIQERVISAETSARLRALMRLVVTKGTAKGAEVAGYLVGGKTGTAEKNTASGYVKNARLSSFMGAFPMNAPRYVVFTMLDNPQGNAKTYGFATGGWTAAPLAGRVISQIAPLLGLPPAQSDVMQISEQQLLRPLGSQVLSGLNIDMDMSHYASVETNRVEE
jgi:cell division protein FtsI (penicillin-binding protein 3)